MCVSITSFCTENVILDGMVGIFFDAITSGIHNTDIDVGCIIAMFCGSPKPVHCCLEILFDTLTCDC